MHQKLAFFSLSEIRQPVNQWLCLVFLGTFCVWTLIYYFAHKAEALSGDYVANVKEMLNK